MGPEHLEQRESGRHESKQRIDGRGRPKAPDEPGESWRRRRRSSEGFRRCASHAPASGAWARTRPSSHAVERDAGARSSQPSRAHVARIPARAGSLVVRGTRVPPPARGRGRVSAPSLASSPVLQAIDGSPVGEGTGQQLRAGSQRDPDVEPAEGRHGRALARAQERRRRRRFDDRGAPTTCPGATASRS